MTVVYKRISIGVAGVALVVGVLLSPNSSRQVYAEVSKPKCDAFEFKKDTLRKSVEDKFSKIKEARQALDSSLLKESARTDSNVKKKEQVIDSTIKVSLKGLHDKAADDEQHAAVDAYGVAVLATVTKYRQSVADARLKFDQDIATMLESYRAEIDGTVDGLISSYEGVIDEAVSVCYDSTVKKGEEIIKPGIEEVSSDYSDNIRNLNDQVAEFNDIRKEALATAQELQEEELLAAQEVLAAAFGGDSPKVIGG